MEKISKHINSYLHSICNLRICKEIAFCVLLYIFTIASSCKKFVEVDLPVNRLVREKVFQDDRTANAAMLDLYGKYRSAGFSGGGINGISMITALSSDELTYLNNLGENPFVSINENAVLTTNKATGEIWNYAYQFIYGSNSLIEGVEKSTNLTPKLKAQLLGEATFLRAFAHFYLVNLFGKIPYITTTDYEINAKASRMEVSSIYELLIKDLKVAKDLLPTDYSSSSGQRSRLNKYAASALLSRVYLYDGKYIEAEQESSIVIENQLYSLEALNNVFKIDNRESIWQLEAYPGNTSTADGQQYVNSQIDQTLTSNLIGSFESGDSRLQNWILQYDVDKYAPNKYKDGSSASSLTEASTVLRLAEQYLIRAEARAMQNKLVGAISAESDLNMIRNRASLTNTSATTKEQLLTAIAIERRHELFTEWGHRWFDLKRTGRADAVLAPLKVSWATTDQLYPIPEKETLINPNMTQNPGYN